MMTAALQLGTEDILHLILLISPGSDCMEHPITIPTHHTYTVLHVHLHLHTLQQAAKLSQVFMHNMYTKVAASFILKDIHDLFSKGGEWELTVLTTNKAGPLNTHFKYLGPTTFSCLPPPQDCELSKFSVIRGCRPQIVLFSSLLFILSTPSYILPPQKKTHQMPRTAPSSEGWVMLAQSQVKKRANQLQNRGQILSQEELARVNQDIMAMEKLVRDFLAGCYVP